MYKVLYLLLVTSAHSQIGNIDENKIYRQLYGTPPPIGNSNQQLSRTITLSPTVTSAPSTLVPPVNPSNPQDQSCTMADGRIGECIPYYLCNSNDTIIVDGTNSIDIRFGGVCESYLDSCCMLPDKLTEPKLPNQEPKKEGCGWRNPKGADMRTTGETQGETKFGEFPWMVAVLRLNTVDGGDEILSIFVGGGSLIHPSAVLTAAHYVSKPRNYKARAGEWDTQNSKEIYPYQDRVVTSTVIHENFNNKNLHFDIAVLFLEKPMDLAPHIGVVCLPPPRERTPHGTRCIATGWGKDKFEKASQYQVILKKIEVPVVERLSCQTALRSTRLGRFFLLHSSFMCAGGEKGIDACKGDGGSPLSCPIPTEQDRYMQSGIVAWGIGCGEDGVPGVYADVSNLRDWIDSKMVVMGFDPKSYSF